MGVSGVQGFEFEIGGHGFECCKYGSLMMMNLAKCSSRMVLLYIVYIIGNS